MVCSSFLFSSARLVVHSLPSSALLGGLVAWNGMLRAATKELQKHHHTSREDISPEAQALLSDVDSLLEELRVRVASVRQLLHTGWLFSPFQCFCVPFSF